MNTAKAEALLEGRQRQKEMKGLYERLGDLLCEAPATMLSIPPNPCNITFHSEHGTVGELNWADGIMRFTGDADESAKAFFAGFAGYFQGKVLESVKDTRQENESLRKDAERYRWLRRFPRKAHRILDIGGRNEQLDAAIDAAKEKP